MKILFIMDSLGAGGAERSTADLWYFLRDAGVEVHILLLAHRSPGIEEEIVAAGFKIDFLEHQGIIRQSKTIAKRIGELRPDLVHSVLFKSNLRTRFARLQSRFIHVESLVNCSYDKIRLKDPNVGKFAFYCYRQLDRLTSFLVDHFHSITHTVKDHYTSELGIDPSKITVVYRGRNAIDANSVVRSDLGLGITAIDFLIINTGRHEFQKGQMFLIQAVGELVRKGYNDIKLVILGRDGNASKNLKQYVEDEQLNQNIFFGGYRGDVSKILCMSDLFAFPSLYEGLGGALIEAQAAGLPIICNSLPVLREVVLEGQNAMMFESEDIESIMKAILFFYENKSRRFHFGQKSKENFKRKFNIGKVNNDMLMLYSKLTFDKTVKKVRV